MTKIMKKNSFGMLVDAPGGESDPELAEVRMQPTDYMELQKQIRKANRDALEASEARKKYKEYADRKIEENKKVMASEVERKVRATMQLVDGRDAEIVQLKERLEAAEQEIQNEKDLNKNLIRIMTERSNQKRGIKPKKGHDGYIVLESRQWKQKYVVDVWDSSDHEDRYANNRGIAIKKGYLNVDHREENVWKSVIQTPYDASIPLAEVMSRIESDLGDVLKSIGCECRIKPEFNGEYYDFGTNDNGYPKNGMYKWLYKANYRVGLWEIEIYTTKNLRIPEYRRSNSNM